MNGVQGHARHMLAAVALVGSVVSCSTGEVTHQRATELELETSYPDGLGYLSSVRELADGKVMAADPMGQALILWNVDVGTGDTLGRVGSGPEEYSQPDAVFPLPGDSTLIVDLGNMRLTSIGSDGGFGSSVPMTLPRSEGFPMILMPRFIDGDGHFYFYLSASRSGQRADSGFIAAYDHVNESIDTVGVVRIPIPEFDRVGNNMVMTRGPLMPHDDWAVASDGRVAVVRAADYSVEWRNVDAPAVLGAPTPFEPVPVGDAERERWADEAYTNTISSTAAMSRGGGVVNMTMSRGAGSRPEVEGIEWPDNLPPFRNDRARVSPEGDLWVERYVSAGVRPTIDVFDSAGNKSEEIVLPIGCRVVGFGDAAVYLACVDEFDLVWLRKYKVVR